MEDISQNVYSVLTQQKPQGKASVLWTPRAQAPTSLPDQRSEVYDWEESCRRSTMTVATTRA